MMVDVPYTAVAYSVEIPAGNIYYDSPAFNYVYPDAMPDTSIHLSPLSGMSAQFTYIDDDGLEHYFSSENTERVGLVLAEDLGLTGTLSDTLPIYRLYPWTIDNTEVPDDFQYWLYAIDTGSLDIPSGDNVFDMYRIPIDYLALHSELEYPAFDGDIAVPDTPGEIVIWLHGIGQILLQDNPLFDLLKIQIGGHSLIWLLLTTGFLVYAGWVIVKWVIP